jgi:alpha-galactosidase
LAVGLFNLGPLPTKLAATWEELGLSGRQHVRDLWRQADLGTVESRFEADVPRHGVAMVRLRKAE